MKLLKKIKSNATVGIYFEIWLLGEKNQDNRYIQIHQITDEKLNVYRPLTLTQADACKLIDELKNFAYKTFYMTVGSGQPYYPGYFTVCAANESEARLLTSNALNGRWCSTYDSFSKIHKLDRIYLGEITANGIEFSENARIDIGDQNV